MNAGGFGWVKVLTLGEMSRGRICRRRNKKEAPLRGRNGASYWLLDMTLERGAYAISSLRQEPSKFRSQAHLLEGCCLSGTLQEQL
jgi:hypothetical protein